MMSTTSCELDVSEFPFDERTCGIQLASWMYANDAINMTCGPNIFLDSYIGWF